MIIETSSATPLEEKERMQCLKLTASQTIFAYEALQYAVLALPFMTSLFSHNKRTDFDIDNKEGKKEDETDSNIDKKRKEEKDIEDVPSLSTSLSSSTDYRAFRLRIKRRLINSSANKHLKKQAPTVMQHELDSLFNDLLVRYNYCLKPISRISIPYVNDI
jgi:hypothetical protein